MSDLGEPLAEQPPEQTAAALVADQQPNATTEEQPPAVAPSECQYCGHFPCGCGG